VDAEVGEHRALGLAVRVVPEVQLEVPDLDDLELDALVGVEVRLVAEGRCRDGLTADDRLVEIGRLGDVLGDDAHVGQPRPAVGRLRHGTQLGRPD